MSAELLDNHVRESGDDAFWAERWQKVRELIHPKGSTMTELKLKATRAKPRQPTKPVEETIYWADLRGLVERFDRWDGKRAWRLPGVDLVEMAPPPVPTPPAAPAPQPEPKPQEATVESKETNGSSGYITTTEAARMLGVAPISVRRMRIDGARRRQSGRVGEHGFEFPRASIERLVASRQEPPAPRGDRRSSAPLTVRKPPQKVVPARRPAPPSATRTSAPSPLTRPERRLELLEMMLKLLVRLVALLEVDHEG